MATESPIRMPGSSSKWPNSSRGAVPNRSGSAPPSMEGSFLAVDNLLSQQGSDYNMKLPSFHGSFQNRGFEEPMTSDPSYLTYYSSKINLNPRLSPWLHSTENQSLGNYVGRVRSNWGLTNIDRPIHTTLATHKEAAEEESGQQQGVHSISDRTNGFSSGSDRHPCPGGSQGLADSWQGNTSGGPTPQHSRSNSSNCEISTGSEIDNNSEISNDVKSTFVKENAASSSEANCSTSHDSTGNHPKMRASVGSEKIRDVSVLVSKMKNTNISNTADLEDKHSREQKQLHEQQNNRGVKTGSHGVNDVIAGSGQFLYGLSSKFSGDSQPVLQSSGFTPPLYATTPPAYITPNPVYNMHSPGIYSPQYGFGAYTMSPNISPQFIHGYPHGAFPFAVSPNFIPQLSGAPSMGNVVHGVEMQYSNKLYGPAGQPSFLDPLYVQYYQQQLGHAYGMPGHMNPLAPRGIVPGSQKNVPEPQKDEPKSLRQLSGPSNQNLGKVGLMGPNYYGVPPNTGIVVHYPPGQLGAPLSPGSAQFVETFPGWQPQRGLEGADSSRLCNFLEELKSGKGRRFELSDIAGHILEFSADQHGSRFIQQKLENCSPEEKAAVFKEVLPHACKLMTDVFGNYVIQKFFEYGNAVQRKELADQLTGQILPLSLQMYGCRVIQKALDVIEPEQKARLVSELDGQVMRCVRDQNGNHVIQKCIENIPTDKIGFVISAFRGHVASLSMHPYGCRVIQRVLERCTDEHQCRFIIEEILESVCALSKDQYGNYVTQHVLERGTPQEQERIVRKLSGHIVQLSQHKFASNVIEKCLEYGGPTERDLIVKEIAGHDEGYSNLLTMMKDQYGNYVVQKIFETCSDDQRATLLSRVRMHAPALKKYTYGKHIVSRLEQLFGEGSNLFENQALS